MESVLERPSWNTGQSSIFDSTWTSGGCRSLPLSLPPISLQSLEDLRLRTSILSFLLLLNKEQQSFKTTGGHKPRKRKAAFAGILKWRISLKPREITPQTTSRFPSNHVPFPSNHVPFPSDHESISLRPRVDFPQTTSRFPSDHESISLKPRVDFPQTTKIAYKWAETRFAGDSGEAVVETQRG